jgi:hypothetical protein
MFLSSILSALPGVRGNAHEGGNCFVACGEGSISSGALGISGEAIVNHYTVRLTRIGNPNHFRSAFNIFQKTAAL